MGTPNYRGGGANQSGGLRGGIRPQMNHRDRPGYFAAEQYRAKDSQHFNLHQNN